MVNRTYISTDTNEELLQGDIAYRSSFGISLGNGSDIIVSSTDSVRTFYGYKSVVDFIPSDIVAVPLIQKLVSVNRYVAPWLGDDMSVAYLLGQLTGDGDNGESIELCTGTKDAHYCIYKWLKEHLPSLCLTERIRENVHYIRVFHKQIVSGGRRKTIWHTLLEQLDMKHDCYNKYVPSWIMQSQDNIKLSYLAGLWDADGCIVEDRNGYCVCHFTNVSKRLLVQVCRLLRHFGVRYFIQPNRIHVVDTERMKELIGKYLVVKRFKGKLLHGNQHGDYPFNLLLQKFSESNLTMSDFSRKYNIARFPKKRKSPFVSYDVAERCGLTQNDVIFHRISSIKKLPEMDHVICGDVIANGIYIRTQ